MVVRCEWLGALRELVHSVTASAAHVRAIEEVARRRFADDANGTSSDLEVADLLEQTARELRRAAASLVHVYSAYTEAACNLGNNLPLNLPARAVVLERGAPRVRSSANAAPDSGG